MEYLHEFRHEAALVIHGNHSLLAAAVDQRFGGDQQHRFAFTGQLQIGVHPRLQRFIRVVDLQAQLQGAGGAIDAGEKGPFADAEGFARPGGNLNGELRGVFNQPGDGFRHRHADPHRIHTLNFRHHIIFGDIHSGTQIEGGNNAIDGGFEGKAGLDFTRGFQAADIVIRHSGEAQAFEDPLDLGGGAVSLLQ